MAEDRVILEDKARQATHSVGNEIDLSFLPKELVSICNGVVRAHHERNGYRELSKDLVHKDTMVCILVHRDLRDLLGAVVAVRRLSILCFIVCGLLLLIAALWHAWLALGLIPGMIIAYYLGKQYQNLRILIAALLLTLEMVADDLAGLKKYLPTVWEVAHTKVDQYFPDDKTRFLDIYIPDRNELDQTELQKMIKERVVPNVS